MSDCIFCNIVAGKFGTVFLAETEHAVAFKDINPEAKVHILVVPKKHYRDVAHLSMSDEPAFLQLTNLAVKMAEHYTTDGAFKLIFNTGESAGQTVFHAHAHVLSNLPKSA